MALVFGGSGVGSGRNQLTLELQPGSVYIIPGGTWKLNLGPYTCYEVLDGQTGTWRVAGAPGSRDQWMDSDGVNHRLANVSGCVIAATVTSGGAGYTSAPAVSINSGGAQFTAILGPVVSTIAVTNGGSSYTYPPLVMINTPPPYGVQATAYSTIAGGVVTSVTMGDQGAGYLAGVPSVSLVNDPRDSTGAGAAAVATLTGQGTVAALLCTNHGTPSGISTSGTLPTLALTGGGYTTVAAASAVMAWSVTAYAVTSAGGSYNAGAMITGYATASGTATYTNTQVQGNALRYRAPSIIATVSAGTIVTGGAVLDGGMLPSNPTAVLIGTTTSSATSALIGALTVGGTNDIAILLPV